jgi:type III pantothenate kinase
MRTLVIDIGNSLIKLAVFDGDEILFIEKLPEFNSEYIEATALKYQIQKAIISSVLDNRIKVLSALTQIREILWFNAETKLPISNLYQSPETLGLDRLAGVVGAILVIDAGTCITYDFINESAQYYGGSISLGIQMRLNALHQQTKKLPLIYFDESFNSPFGTNTQQSILSGVINGVIGEIKGFIEHYHSLNTSLKIILCGGNATFFDTRFKNSIFAHQIINEPNLVLIGLNAIVNY